MAKIIDINTVSRRAVAALLPHGGQRIIHKRLAKKGLELSLPTIARAFNPDYPMNERYERVIAEAISYTEEVKTRRKLQVSDETYKELKKTGS